MVLERVGSQEEQGWMEWPGSPEEDKQALAARGGEIPSVDVEDVEDGGKRWKTPP